MSQPSCKDDLVATAVISREPSTQDYPHDVGVGTMQPPVLTQQEERRIWRRIDVRVLPIVSILYLCAFLDRSNIGNAKLQGLLTQLKLNGHRYDVALSIFFVSYGLFAIPATLVMKRLRPSRFLPSITVLWGLMTILMGLVKNYPQLVGVRICLGAAESGLAGGLWLFLSCWYPRYMVHTRLGVWYAGGTFAGAFSGLMAFGISYMSGAGGLLGWSWIFIIEGLATVVVGSITFFVFVDLPETATFLTPEERAYVLHSKTCDGLSVGEEQHFELRHLKEALLDWQIWLLWFIDVTVTAPVYGISLFLPSIINGFGYNATISQLLTVPVYVVATITVLAWAYWGDHYQMRAPCVFAGLCLCAIGYGINLSNASIGVKYFGTYLCAMGGYAATPTVDAWIANNVAGHYKRAIACGGGVIAGAVGGIIASTVYRTQDEPRYIFGHGIELGLIGAGMVATAITVLAYKSINGQRDVRVSELQEKGQEFSAQEMRRLGDRAPGFRYTL